jgi:hypothetical protein
MSAPSPITVPGLANDSWTAARVCSTAAMAENEMNTGDVIDGVTLVNGDRILVADPANQLSSNGIYVAGTTPARAADADASGDFVRHKTVAVTAGTANAGRVFSYVGKASPTVDTDAITFAAGPQAITVP